MKAADILILAAVAVLLVLALISIRRHRGCCASCTGNCAECKRMINKKADRKTTPESTSNHPKEP